MFYDYLQVREEFDDLVGGYRHRMFHAFHFGAVGLSVQAGNTKYSRPRKDLDDLSAYESWEIAFLDGEGSLISPHELENLPAPLESFIDRAWGGSDVVAGYVSTSVVETIFQCLCEEFGYPPDVTPPRERGSLQYRLEALKERERTPPVRINAAALRGKLS